MMDRQHNNPRSVSNIDTGEQWQRLSAIAIVQFVVSSVKEMLQGLVYIVPAVAVSANVADNIDNLNAVTIVLLIVFGMGVSGLLNFLAYRFRVYQQHVEIKRGVLKRQFTNLPFWRIQNVKIEQPFYFRPFGYARVTMDTAGSAGKEAEIVAVPWQYANGLKEAVLSVQSAAPVDAQDAVSNDAASKEGEAEIVLIRRQLKDLVLHGITNNRIWILLGAAAPFFDEGFEYFNHWLTENQLGLKQLLGDQAAAWWQMGLYSVILAAIILSMLALLSIGGAIFTFYGYTLCRQGERYVRRSGLLNRQEVGMFASRIQVVSAKQDWLDHLLNRVNLYFEQNTSFSAANRNDLTCASKLLVPSILPGEADALCKEVMPDSTLLRDRYTRIHPRFIWRWSLLLSAPVLLLFSVSLVKSWWLAALLSALTVPVLVGLIWLRWRRWGIAIDDNYIYIQSGLIGCDTRCFAHAKLQQVSLLQSWWMKRRRLASIRFAMASGSLTVPFLPQTIAEKLADLSLHSVESRRCSWM